MRRTAELCIVDGDVAVLDSTAMLLAGRGYRVSTFASAEQTLDYLDGGAVPACILSDIRLPGMSGPDLLAAMQRRGVNIPLILMSGLSNAATAAFAIRAGAEGFVEKPFEEDRLIAAIDRAMRTVVAHYASHA